MRRRAPLAGIPLLLLALVACAQPAQPARPGAPGRSPEHRWAAFEQRATEAAEAWRAAPGAAAWQKGYVPLQDATVLPADPGFDGDTKQAFLAGWYRSAVELSRSQPAKGTIRFPDGTTLAVPLVSAAGAYAQIDQGDPPPCAGRPAPPPASPTGPDSPVSTPAGAACVPLTVTAATLGTVTVRTSRGEARVPAWLFTVDELSGPVARVAVAPSAVAQVPAAASPGRPPAAELVAAQDLTEVDGAKLSYRLGVGACDTGVTPLVQEHADVVVVGGGIVPSTGVCTAQLVLAPVTVTLGAPLGARPVLDAVSGQPLVLTIR